MNKILATIAGAALMVLPAAAFAGSTSGNVSVSANVNAACTLNTTGPSAALSFANYDPSAPAAQNSTGGNESIQCTNTTAYTLSIPSSAILAGPNPGDSIAVSNIAGPAGGTGNGLVQPFTIAGQLAAGQYAAPGSYSGSITVGANF